MVLIIILVFLDPDVILGISVLDLHILIVLDVYLNRLLVR